MLILSADMRPNDEYSSRVSAMGDKPVPRHRFMHSIDTATTPLTQASERSLEVSTACRNP